MVERKHFGGDREAAFDYLGIGRSLLDQLLLSMRMNNLQVLSRTVQLQNGVSIIVSSVFGHHDIRIDAPADASQRAHDEIHRLADQIQHYSGYVGLVDFVGLKSDVKITVTTRTPAPPPPPPEPPPPPPVITPPPSGGGSSPDPGTTSTTIKVTDYVRVKTDVTVVLSVRKTVPGSVVPAGPSVIIGGGTSGGDGFVWDDYNGYTQLDDGGNWALQRRNVAVLGISPDGNVLCGNLEQYDSSPNTALTNPFNGQTPPVGWVFIAAKWASRTDKPQLPKYNHATGWPSDAYSVSNDGNTVKGRMSGEGMGGKGFTWNGRAGTSYTVTSTIPATMGLTSPDGKVHVSGAGTYTINGQTKTWRGPVGLARDAPSDAIPYCVVHVTPPMVSEPEHDVVTTYVFEFSG